MKDLIVDGRIIWVVMKLGGGSWIGLLWLGIRMSGWGVVNR